MHLRRQASKKIETYRYTQLELKKKKKKKIQNCMITEIMGFKDH